MTVSDPKADFFTHGGGSLTAAQLVARIRTRHPQVAVNDVYLHPKLGALATRLDALGATRTVRRDVAPTPRRAALAQALLMAPMLALVGLRWASVAAAISTVAAVAVPWMPTVPWWSLALAWLVLFSPAGRIGIAAGGARLLLRGVRPGSYPRGGSVHVRLWAATRLAELSGATGVSSASWTTRYARALGAKIGNDVDLHSAPPVTGLLKIGRGAAVAPEVDLGGYWVDGDVVRIGKIRIGAGATVGSRSTLLPGARIGKGSRGRGRVDGLRGGPRRSALGGLARAAGRQVRRVVAVDPPVALALLGARLRHHVDAPRAAARGGGAACARDRRGRRRRNGVPRGGDERGAADGRTRDGGLPGRRTRRSSWPACACSASAWPRASTRCTAAQAGRSGPRSG